MAKMGSGTGLREIPLSQIVDTGNVRSDYSDIEELAESILKNGQLQPVLVKVTAEKDENGLDRFELIAGHRRWRAVQYLCEVKKESLTSLKAIIVTGDKLTLQLVENLQRSDLTAAERESGIYEMCKAGVSQKEVAARLSKLDGFVSRNISAYKVRDAAKSAGVDASGLATGTLNEIQAATVADYAELVKKILQGGGTLGAARAVMEDYRVAHCKPANPQKEKARAKAATPSARAQGSGGLSDPLGIEVIDHDDPISDFVSDLELGDDDEESEPNSPPKNHAAKPESKKTAPPPEFKPWLDDFDPPHKQVDFNDICVSIMRYAKENEAVLSACKVDTTCEACNDRCPYFYKYEAAKDIIALLHAGL